MNGEEKAVCDLMLLKIIRIWMVGYLSFWLGNPQQKGEKSLNEKVRKTSTKVLGNPQQKGWIIQNESV